VRLLLIIPYVFFFLAGDYVSATLTYIVAFITDIDGTIARKIGATSKFGSLYDPLVDATFMITALCLLVWKGQILLWPVVIYLAAVLFKAIPATLFLKKHKRVRSEIVSKAISFAGVLTVILGTMRVPFWITTSVLLLGTVLQSIMAIRWLR
jgi:phosphatidylglycerophosphate synthase